MNNFFTILKIDPFDEELEKTFRHQLNLKAKPLFSFIYWAGGLIVLFYFMRSLLIDTSSVILLSRAAYFIFWASLVYKTLYAKNTISFDHSYIIYAAGGTLFTTFFYGILEQNSQFFITSILLFLIGLLLCQLRARVMAWVAVIAVVNPALVLYVHQGLTKEEISNIIIIGVWACSTFIAAIIFEGVNRKIFSFSQALKKSRDREAEANQAKSNFLSLMSHEIRTPLTSIMGYSELALSSKYDQEVSANALATIHRNSRHLLTLINDILDLSKIESEKLTLELISTPVITIIEDAASIVRASAIDKKLTFNIEYQWPLPKAIHTDPTRLRQVLINLLGNAIKFTQEGSVTLRASYHKSTLFFEIKDTGIGMTESEQTNLFQKFTQADSSTTRNFGGSGLGLYLSKKIALLMGGGIIVSSKLGMGSCFLLTVDVKQDGIEFNNSLPTIDKIADTYQDKERLTGHVLLVDDYDDNRTFIGALLTSFGLTVDYAENGEKGVEKALFDDFDLILMDIQMPVMDGIEAMKLLKKIGCGSPIIALTANAMSHEIKSYFNVGFDDFLSKPIETAIFYDKVTKYLAKNKAKFIDESNVFDLAALTESYQNSLINVVNKLKNAQKNNDWLTLEKMGHQIKGAAPSFGFKKIGEYATIIESAAIAKDKEKSDKTLQLIYQKIKRLSE
jgi:signal transduction histidine kinase/FixJ family two-component response regulator